MTQQLTPQAIENACRAAGMEIPPVQRFTIRKWIQHRRGHPCDQKQCGSEQRRYLIDTDIPTQSGIYFFWRREQPFYVGQAVNIRQRLKCHGDNKRCCDQVAWVLCEQDKLNVAESFYIGILRPIANFKKRRWVRVNEGASYFHEECIGDLTVSRTPSYRFPVQEPLPEGAVIRFPGRG